MFRKGLQHVVSGASFRIPAAQRIMTPPVQKLIQPTQVQAVILDRSGTVTDAHVIAPAYAFVEAFKAKGIDLTMKEARGPMGLRKDLHIRALLQMPSVVAKFTSVKGRKPDLDKDTAELFAEFGPIQLACLRAHAALLPGALEMVNGLRTQNIKTGLTTGFLRDQENILDEENRKQGLKLDVTVTGDDLQNKNVGFRPLPFMVRRNMELLGIVDPRSVVKVDDTIGGVGEGLNAGCWTIAISNYSNYTDIDSLKQLKHMTDRELGVRQEASRNKLLKESGAHYLVANPLEILAVIKDINKRLEKGETPTAEHEAAKPAVLADNKKVVRMR